MSVTKLTIEFGAMAPPIRDQVRAAGLKLIAVEATRMQKAADCIVYLSVRDLITESATAAARKKLVKRLATMVRP